MDARERFSNEQASLHQVAKNATNSMYTALPGIIESFNAAKMTVTVQPAIRSVVQDKDGNFKTVSIPLLVDVPVYFPSGGGCTLTFPIAVGDEALVVFSSRCIDSWWASGGQQNPAIDRSFDLSDGFALIGVFSQPRVIGGISGSATQLRTADGLNIVEVSPAAGTVRLKAATKIILDSDAQVNGNLYVTEEITEGPGHLPFSTHRHTGVQTGGGETGGPVA